jgi:hypothetical protein
MAGFCCEMQARGLLGHADIITITKKDGTRSQRCGVCEIGPSCSNPQKLVFKFRFVASADCGLIAGTCKPTEAGIAQYNRDRVEPAGHTVVRRTPATPGLGGTYTFPTVTTPRLPVGYTLPLQ